MVITRIVLGTVPLLHNKKLVESGSITVKDREEAS
jgi:hypothetical protein